MSQNKKTNLPPFLEGIYLAENWTELTNLVLPGVAYNESLRFENDADLFDDPVVCRLYESLYRIKRGSFVCSLAKEFYAECIDLPDGSNIIEVGCGPGIVLTELARLANDNGHDWNFLGFDPSVEMIHIAVENQKKSALKNVKFACSKGSGHQGRNILSKASIVIMRNVLSWIEDAEKELATWEKLLPKGITLLSREVRRDIPFAQVKRRLIESCQFEIGEQTLYYPVKAYLTAYLRAYKPIELKKLLEAYFKNVELSPPSSCLDSDQGKIFEAEMQFRCSV